MEDICRSVQEIVYRMASEKNIEITDTSNLYNAGVMDSLNIIILLSRLQSDLSVDIQEEALAPENFESIKAVCTFVLAAISK
ncbi:phosphopantetheine-binding protein [Cohnella cellulosilytica]|uniref:Phosphopantetheine-binding protein n=1 Tax=Cohnella cellulosilytica TaxID=986710 RepID=A0ABW2FLX8_9BACL